MYNFNYNMNDERRCEIIGIPEAGRYPMGGVHYFKHLTLDQLNTLLEEKFIDPETAMNNTPYHYEIKEFMEKYPMFTARGYIVCPQRKDYRTSLEGVDYTGEVDQQMMADFHERFGDADEFECDENGCHCWYD